jgi:uncharacterized membrane protein
MAAPPRLSDTAALTRRWQWVLKKFISQLWVKASFYAVLAVGSAFLALIVKPYLPPDIGAKIGADSVDSILTIIASSMLAVTTFSLGVVVSAFNGAASQVTPRAAQLLMDDTSAQTALATFLGAFLYSLVGIIALKTGIYGDSGRLVLFVVTVAVVMVIFATFIRWIEILRQFGRMGDTISRIEKVATLSLDARVQSPFLGGNPLRGDLPERVIPLLSGETGYVQHIDIKKLSQLAEENDLEIYVESLPGTFVHQASSLAYFTGSDDSPELMEKIAVAWSIGVSRDFEQDPRFGLIVLAEVASRALSPAVNDPGTAIDVIGRGVRILSRWTELEKVDVSYPRLWVAGLNLEDFFNDIFRPIARDGASLIEVQIRIQKALLSLAQVDQKTFLGAARRHSREALERVGKSRLIKSEIEEITRVAGEMEELEKKGTPSRI